MSALNLFEELTAIARALEAEEIPYAICGGVALAVHGAPRFTKDIDLLVPPASLDRAKAAARGRGFTGEDPPLRLGEAAIEEHRLVKWADGERLMLDLILVSEVLEPAWRARERVVLPDGPLWTLSRSGLMQMKRAAGRPQDLADLARLEAEAP